MIIRGFESSKHRVAISEDQRYCIDANVSTVWTELAAMEVPNSRSLPQW
jgi:hypothetical protein